MKHNSDIEKQLAVEKIHCQAEQSRLSPEQYKLDLIGRGKLRTNDSVKLGSSVLCPEPAEEHFGILDNLRLLRKINQRDPESAF